MVIWRRATQMKNYFCESIQNFGLEPGPTAQSGMDSSTCATKEETKIFLGSAAGYPSGATTRLN